MTRSCSPGTTGSRCRCSTGGGRGDRPARPAVLRPDGASLRRSRPQRVLRRAGGARGRARASGAARGARRRRGGGADSRGRVAEGARRGVLGAPLGARPLARASRELDRPCAEIETFDGHTMFYADRGRAERAAFLVASRKRRRHARGPAARGREHLELIEAVVPTARRARCVRLRGGRDEPGRPLGRAPRRAGRRARALRARRRRGCPLPRRQADVRGRVRGGARPAAPAGRPEPRPAPVPVSRAQQTARWVGLLYGRAPALDDAAESYHEASKISPSMIGRQVEGARRLETSPELQLSSTRAVKRHGGVAGSRCRAASSDRGCGRRSTSGRRPRVRGRCLAGELASLLLAGYGVTHALDSADGRPCSRCGPSPPAGRSTRSSSTSPLCGSTASSPACTTSIRSGRARRPSGSASAPRGGRALDVPGDRVGCAALVLVAAIFGRSRFKYGLRAYRFALLETGHVGQNVLLAATALGLAAVPLGGYYDRRADEFLGLDGVNESTLYTIAVEGARVTNESSGPLSCGWPHSDRSPARRLSACSADGRLSALRLPQSARARDGRPLAHTRAHDRCARRGRLGEGAALGGLRSPSGRGRRWRASSASGSRLRTGPLGRRAPSTASPAPGSALRFSAPGLSPRSRRTGSTTCSSTAVHGRTRTGAQPVIAAALRGVTKRLG